MGEDGDKTFNENFSSKNHGHSLKRLFVSVSFILFLFNIEISQYSRFGNSSFLLIIQYDSLFRNNYIYYPQK